MKNIKDVLNAYEEAPSADVWERLNARLDAEMPVTENVHRLQRVKVWKWTAVGLSVLIIGGAVLVSVLLHHRVNQNVIAENNTEVVGGEAVNEMDAVVESVETIEQETVPATKEPVQTAQSSNVRDITMEKQEDQSKLKEESISSKANARQVVLPPNSTLAKQLAADPVLKKLSDESVDWSMPVHLSIPNLFTPNNDGVNDFFVIEGLENYASPRLVVRDKNNKVVYQNNAYKNTWGGEDCPEGVYSYEFTFVYNGIENLATGKVRIMRS